MTPHLSIDSPLDPQSIGILFWNINKKPLSNQITSIVQEHNIDIITLAENTINQAQLLQTLNTNNDQVFLFDEITNKKITLLYRLPQKFIEPTEDNLGISIRHITPPFGHSFILASAHFPSKLHRDEHDHLSFSSRAAEMIVAAERKYGHSRSVLVGDLNMNPFEPGLTAASGLHAIMSRKIASKLSRVYDEREYPYFYNPMWGRMGDSSTGPPGTYHCGPTGNISYFWNTFDQVLIRPSLLQYFPDETLKILTSCGPFNFANKHGAPDPTQASDHFPLIFRITLN